MISSPDQNQINRALGVVKKFWFVLIFLNVSFEVSLRYICKNVVVDAVRVECDACSWLVFYTICVCLFGFGRTAYLEKTRRPEGRTLPKNTPKTQVVG